MFGSGIRVSSARLFAVYLIEALTVAVAGVIAFGLRFDFNVPAGYVPALKSALIVWVVIKLAAFRLLGLDRRWARYASMADFLRLAACNLIGSGVGLAVLVVLRSGVPRTVYVIDFLLCFTLAAGTRAGTRIVSDAVSSSACGYEPQEDADLWRGRCRFYAPPGYSAESCAAL